MDGNGRGQTRRADVIIRNSRTTRIRLNALNARGTGECFLVGSKVHSKRTYRVFHLVVKYCTNNHEAFSRWRVTGTGVTRER